MKVRLHGMVMHTRVLGPGTRAAIWFQGCHRNCKGCMSQSSRDADGGTLVEVDAIFDQIAGVTDIEGVTLSGGEVFLQIDALYKLLRKIKNNTDLGVIIYTGYYIEELRNLGDERVDEILSGLADIIIDGPYVDELNDGRSLVGSSNQNVNFITERYVNNKELYEGMQRNTEVYIDGNEIHFIGIPEKETLKKFRKAIRKLEQ